MDNDLKKMFVLLNFKKNTLEKFLRSCTDTKEKEEIQKQLDAIQIKLKLLKKEQALRKMEEIKNDKCKKR